MRKIMLDGRDMDSREQLHRVLAEALQLPGYYGKNLDALHDCLGELRDIDITLRNQQAMLNRLGGYGLQVIAMLEEEAKSRPDFRFRLA